MSKKNITLSCLLVVLLVCSCVLMTACAKNYEVKWNVDSHATVAVEGSKKLPSKAEENSTITFTAEGKDGYKIASVTYKIGEKERSVSAKNGKYSVSVSNDLEIIVKTEKAIESVSVTTNPTQMTYYTGDELDPEGMVVTAKYKTGDSEPVTNYSINYANDEVAAFSRGDTGFTVTYKGVTSTEVKFASAVETKVVLDPKGGVISEAAINALETNDRIHHFVKDDDGVITFTFADIPEQNAIELPGGTDIRILPTEDTSGYPFNYWRSESLAATVSKISNDTITTSDTIVARYQVKLFEVKKVALRLGEDGIPYLDVTIQFVNDGPAYIYLYEGNKFISVKDEEITATKGETKVLSYNLNKLTEAKTDEVPSFEGAWMDIRVNTDVYGVSYTSNVVVDPYDSLAVVGEMIHDDTNCFKLHYYMRDAKTELKVYYRPYQYTYSIDTKEVDGVPSLVIEGKINTAMVDNIADYANGKVSIDWLGGLEGTINADGSWKIVKTISEIETGTTKAGKISFASADGSKNIEVTANDGKLDLAACETKFDYADGFFTGERSYATIKTFGKYELAIGCDWNEPFLSYQYLGDMIRPDKVELVAEEEKPYLVITGTYGEDFTDETLLAAFLAMARERDGFDLQRYSDWTYYVKQLGEDETFPEIVKLSYANGTFTIKIDLSGATDPNGYYMHVKGSNFNARKWTFGQSITVGKYKYSLGYGKIDWASSLMTLWVENIANPEFLATSASLEKVGEEGFLVLTGTWNTKKCTLDIANEEIANIENYDFQHYNSYDYVNPSKIGEAKEDGTFKVYFALKDLTKTNGFYYVHFATNGDVKVAGEGTLTIGTTTYTLKQHEANDWTNTLTSIEVTVAE